MSRKAPCMHLICWIATLQNINMGPHIHTHSLVQFLSIRIDSKGIGRCEAVAQGAKLLNHTDMPATALYIFSYWLQSLNCGHTGAQPHSLEGFW